MRKVIFLICAVMVFCCTTAWAADIPMSPYVEKMVVRNDPGVPANSIGIQAVWDAGRGMWRRQVIPFNGANKSGITDEMVKMAGDLCPSRLGAYGWEPYGFKIIAINGKLVAEGAGRELTGPAVENVTPRAEPAPQVAPAPVAQSTPAPQTATVAVPYDDTAVKGRLAALEAAAKQRAPRTAAVRKPARRAQSKEQLCASYIAAAKEAEEAKTAAEGAKDEALSAMEKSGLAAKKVEQQLAAAQEALAKKTDELKNAQSEADRAVDNGKILLWLFTAALVLLVLVIVIALATRRRRAPARPTEPAEPAGPAAPNGPAVP